MHLGHDSGNAAIFAAGDPKGVTPRKIIEPDQKLQLNLGPIQSKPFRAFLASGDFL